MLGRFYQWLWFHLEFWWTPLDRRPLTFIFRDWIFTHPWWFAGILLGEACALIFFALFHPLWALLIGCISSFVLAHLIFGTAWIEGQQEYPEYLGEED